jgi:hypothetical protein
MRMYHRKEGKIIKERDDIMSATRYATMSVRYATIHKEKPRMEYAIGTQDFEYQYFS